MSDKEQGPTESVLRRIEGFAKDHHDSGYEQGYVDAYNKTRKVLARRSIAWLLVGVLVGGLIAWQVTTLSLRAEESGNETPQVFDPEEFGATPGLELTLAANFARSYTVGIVSERLNRLGQVSERRSGSGFFYKDEGYILTNYHVVKGAGKISVEWRGRIYPARLVGGDSGNRDIALLRIKTKGVKGAKLLPLDKSVEIAEQVIAVGSPLGLDYTVTAGIISHTSRKLRDASGVSYLQTDCAINKGNSGGPLVNRQGHVVGMNTKIVSSSGDSAGISFAIPVQDLRKVADALIENDQGESADIESDGTSSETAYLGVRVALLDSGQGLLVTEVIRGQPAELGGIKVDDIITGIQGVRVYGRNDLVNEITLRYKPGDEVRVNLLRDGKENTANVTLGGIDHSNR